MFPTVAGIEEMLYKCVLNEYMNKDLPAFTPIWPVSRVLFAHFRLLEDLIGAGAQQ